MEKGNGLFHKLDKWVGIPLVFLLGAFKKKHSLPLIINRIAVLNLGSIGDNVLMSAVISDLRTQYAQAEIIAFTGSTNYHIVKQIDGFNKVEQLQLTNVKSSIQKIRSEGEFDVLIDFGPWPRINSIYSSFFKAVCKIGFNSARQYRHYVYDITVKHSSNIHELLNFRNLVKRLCDAEIKHVPSIVVKPTEKAVKFIANAGNYCIFHPWPGGYKSYMKEWPNEYWVALFTRLKSNFDHVVITGAPSDTEKTNELFALLDDGEKAINAAGKYNLQEVCHIISCASLVVSVNTGVAHIAAALNKKQICLHGPTNVDRWKPYSDKTISITPQSGNFGYLNFGFEYNKANGNCMEDITVEQVYSAFLNLMSNKINNNEIE